MADIALAPRRRRARGALRAAAGAGLGAAAALGQAPYDLWPVALLALAGIFAVALGLERRQGWTLFGWSVGVGYFALALIWIVEPFLVDAALHGWMAPFALAGMAFGLGLFWAAAFALAGRAPRWRLGWLVLLWAAAEFARAYVLTGFPWALVGYLWLETPALQWAAVVGPHGLTLATLALAAVAGAALAAAGGISAAAGNRGAAGGTQAVRTGLAAAAGLAALLAGGWSLTPPLQDLTGRPVVRLVQPNAPQHLKWHPDHIPVFYERQIRYTAALAAGAAPDLVLWPETALPMLLENASGAFAQMASAAGGATVAAGIQRAESGRYYNALVALRPDGTVRDIYDKHHLVPFGEYMPAPGFFAHFQIGGLAARAEGGYSAGPGPRLLDLGALGQALPLICYEAVFPQDVGGAPERPDWLMHVTNDAWFGTQSGPYQHLAQARIRAVEQGLPLVRAANTGVSAAIDGAGRVLAEIPLGEAGFVDVALPPPLRLTPYARSGDLPALLVLIAGGLSLAALGAFRSARTITD